MKIVGHRGARGLAPENTITSLKKALEHKVDEIECDVRVTKDNVVVLHHDRLITYKKLRIKSHTYTELHTHDDDLTTLNQALEVVPESTPLQIEIKPHTKTAPIIKIIQTELKKGRKPKSLLIGSKSQAILSEMHRAFPEVQKVVIEPWSSVRAVYRARRVNTKRISMNKISLWSGVIHSLNKRGYKLYAYTLNDTEKAKAWAKNGLAGVITDYPDQFEQ